MFVYMSMRHYFGSHVWRAVFEDMFVRLFKRLLWTNTDFADIPVFTVPLPLGDSEIDASVLSCPPSISNRYCCPIFFTLPIRKRPRRFLAAAPSSVSSAPPALRYGRHVVVRILDTR